MLLFFLFQIKSESDTFVMLMLSEELKSLNDKTAKALIPTVIYIGTLMVVGLSGNPLVIYFYWRKEKTTPSHIFIVTLAIFDILACLISMPFEIVDLMLFYTFESLVACKILCFCNYFFSIGSACILFFIAVDRYRKVCKTSEVTDKHWMVQGRNYRFNKFLHCIFDTVCILL